jgi:hypothetical protein
MVSCEPDEYGEEGEVAEVRREALLPKFFTTNLLIVFSLPVRFANPGNK